MHRFRVSGICDRRFKEFLPEFAEAYGFDFGLITYKWPTWLNKQTEKQRIIWAYKVLFLDVLFPLSLDRVVFVDADQIVRTDMKELMSLDLKGAPYAYTPMCDNNKEMEGYRFWKQGFWRDHLRGRPYHISALYVVDLIRFRAMAAGDQLRIMCASAAMGGRVGGRELGRAAHLCSLLGAFFLRISACMPLGPWLFCSAAMTASVLHAHISRICPSGVLF